MEPKRSKNDTNPLDPGVGERAGNSFESTRPGPPTEEVRGGATREVGTRQSGSADADFQLDAPTQLIHDKVTSYPSVFVPPKTRESATYQPPRVSLKDISHPPSTPPSFNRAPAVPVYPPGS